LIFLDDPGGLILRPRRIVFMAYTEITTGESEKNFERGRAYMLAAVQDPNDPTSQNFMHALHEYIRSILAAEVAMVKGLNDVLERVDRIETILKTRR
jgi:hypothetical protein